MARTTAKVGGKSRPRPLARASRPVLSVEAAAHLAGLKAGLKALEACMTKACNTRDVLLAEIARVEKGTMH